MVVPLTEPEKRALITGVAGQDGSYLAELLLDRGYEVVGLARGSQLSSLGRLQHLLDRIELTHGDLLDLDDLTRLLQEIQPHEIYNLAGTSLVSSSWDAPLADVQVTGAGVARLLEAVRHSCPAARVYQASTSEMFGAATESPQNEETAFHPRNPYGASKLYGHWMTVAYRQRHGIFACSGILYNHESPRRSRAFVTRKVTHGAARIKLGLDNELRLGNLEAQRDWGYAGDYVKAMWSMLQLDHPDDFVIATGQLHTVRQLCQIAFEHLGLDYQDYVFQDPRHFRPAEEVPLVGDSSKARAVLGWAPSVEFKAMIEGMVEADLAALSAGERPDKTPGYRTQRELDVGPQLQGG